VCSRERWPRRLFIQRQRSTTKYPLSPPLPLVISVKWIGRKRQRRCAQIRTNRSATNRRQRLSGGGGRRLAAAATTTTTVPLLRSSSWQSTLIKKREQRKVPRLLSSDTLSECALTLFGRGDSSGEAILLRLSSSVM